MKRRRWSFRPVRATTAAERWQRRRRDRSDAGDTLIEVLISITVISIAAVAILLAFATSISGSGVHRNVVTFDTMLHTAAAEATAAVQQQGTSTFSTCGAAAAAAQAGISLPSGSGFTAQITGVQYWNGSTWVTGSLAGGCPAGFSTLQSASGLQQLTLTVTYKGQNETTTAVASNPVSPVSGQTCTGTKQLAWVAQPGNGQAGQALFPAPTVVVEDTSGTPCGNDASAVNLAITSGTGTSGAALSSCTASLGNGETTFQNCSINTLGSNYTLTASDPTDGLTPIASLPFNISAGVPVKLVFAKSPSAGTGGTAFSPQQPVVDIEDVAGNPVPGDSSTVTLAIGNNPGGGTLSGCSSTTVNGVATFSYCEIDKVGAGYTLTATDAADNLTIPVSSSTFNITPGPATQLAFATSPSTTVVGDPLAPQPAVVVEDAGGNATTINMGTVSLAIGTNPGGGTLSGCSPATSGATVTFASCSINRTGNGYTLTASDGSLTPATSGPFNVAVASLTSFKVSPQTTTPTAGTAFNVTITALDQSGYTFPGLTGTQSIVFSGPSKSPNGTAPVYPATVSFSGGVGTASVTLYDAQTTTLTASLGAVTGTSGNVTVSALGTVTAFSVANPGTQTAGTAFGATINAVDTYGNTVTSYAGSKTLTFSGPSNSPSGSSPTYPGRTTFTSGVGTPSITLVDAQTTTLTATSGSVTGTSGSFVVNPGSPGSFAVTNPGTQTAGTPFNVTITATDQFGNAATNYTGSQTITFSGPANSPNGTTPVYPATVTFTAGAGTASVTLYDAQTTAITATQGAASGTSGSFTVNGAGSLGAFSVSNPGTQVAGTAFNVTITAGDPYGNADASFSGSQSLVFSGPGNSPNGHAPTYPSTVTFTAGVGTASVTLFDAQTTALTVTDGTISGTSANFLVNGASSASSFKLAAPVTQTAGTAFTEQITAIDQYGNTATGYSGAKAVTYSGPGNSPNGTPPTYPGTTTFTNGVANPSITLFDVQATTLTATQGVATGTSASFSVVAGGAKSFSVANPGTQTVGVAFGATVTAVDQWGNTATGYTGSKTITFSGPANSPNGTAPSYPASVTFTAGVGTASVTLYDAQSTTLTATQGTITGTSGSFTVNGTGTTAGFLLSTPTPTAGTAFTDTVTAVDQYGNTTTGYTGSKTITFSGPANSPNGTAPSYPASVTFTAGVGTASVTLYDAQSTTLTATQSTITGTSGSFTVSPGAANAFSLPTPATQTAGTAFNESITALDTWGNTATGYTGAKTVTFSGPSNAPNGNSPSYPASVTFTNGVGTASITLVDAQSTTLTATQGSITGTTGSFTVNVGSTTKFALSTPTPTAGTAFTETITATDAQGNTTPGYTGAKTVTFSGPASSPKGNAPSYPASVTFTGGVGTATITLYDAQSTTLTATQGTISGTSTSFTVSPATAVSFTIPSPGTQTAGTSFNPTLTALDTYGNTATGYTGSKTITFSGPANSPNGTAPSYPASVTFTAGVGTASVTLYDAQSTTLTATQSTITGTSGSFTVSPGAANAFSLPTPATQTAGTAFNESITALDTWGNTATGYTGAKTVTFSGPSNAPNGNSPSYPASVTFTNGVGTASITLVDAQSTTLTATQGSITGTTGSFTVNVGSTTKFALSTPTPTAGTAFTETITATDAQGNTTPGYTGAKTVTFSGPASSPKGNAPSYPASVTFTGGVGTATITLYDAQSTTLTATQGTISGTSTSFTVSPATAVSFTIPSPGTQTAGTSFNPTLTALDTYGNTATGYTGSKTITFSGPANSPNGTAPSYPASVTFTAGVGTASVTLYDAQSTTLTATQSTITGTSGSFTVSPGAANAFSLPTPATQTAGTAFNESITALDTWGNTATGYTGAKTVTFSGPSNAPNGNSPSYPASVTFTNGVGTASITLVDAQSTTLTATQGSITGTTGSFTVNVGSTTKFALSTPTPTAGTAFTETITATDAQGNTTPGYTGAKTVTFSGPASSPKGNAPSYPASVTFTGGVGTATITLYDAQSTTLTATQGTISGTSTSFTVSPATAVSFTIPSPGTQTAGTSFNPTLTALDTYGNTASTYTGAQTITFSGPANSPNGTAPSYPASVTFTAGVGTASITLVDAQSTTLTATQGGVTGTSPSFTVSPGATTTFKVPTPATQTAGTAFNEQLTATDNSGNTTPGYTGAKAVTFSGPANSPNGTAPSYPASVTFTAGVGTASVTLYDAQSTTLTATQGSVSGTSGSFTVNGLTTTSSFVLSTPAPTAGTAFSETIQAADTYGNPTTSYTGTKTLTFTGPANSPDGTTPTYPGSVTFTNGVGTASITLVDAQSTTLTATQGTISGTSTSFTVSPAAQASLYLTNITQNPTPNVTCTGPAGSLTTCSSTGEGSLNGNGNAGKRTITASLELVDTFGNVVTNSGGNLTVNVSSSGSVSSFTPGSGTLTIPSGSSTTTGQFSLVRSAGTGTSATVTAKVGGTTELTVTLSA